MSDLTYLIPAARWLVQMNLGKPFKKNHFFGPPDHRTMATSFIVEMDDGNFCLILPYPDFEYRQKKITFHQGALADPLIVKCIFLIPEILDESKIDTLIDIFEGKKTVEVWDAKILNELFCKYLALDNKAIIRTNDDMFQIAKKIDEHTIQHSISNIPQELYTNHGHQLLNLHSKFPHTTSLRILQEAERLGTNDLFSTDEYSLVKEVVVVSGDLKGFTSLMEKATRNRSPSYFGSLLKEWYENISKIIGEHDGFLDKFIGDGFLAFFGYPFGDNKDVYLMNAYNCSCKLIEVTNRLICNAIVKNIYPLLSEHNIGCLRIGISSGELFTLPTSILSNDSYRHFLILGNPIIEASRIQDATDASTIGIDLETFNRLKSLVSRIDKGGNSRSKQAKEQTLSFFQIEP